MNEQDLGKMDKALRRKVDPVELEALEGYRSLLAEEHAAAEEQNIPFIIPDWPEYLAEYLVAEIQNLREEQQCSIHVSIRTESSQSGRRSER